MSTPFPVAPTEGALNRLRQLLGKDGREGAFLRVGIKGGGCSGLEYVLRIDVTPTPYDLAEEFEGVRIVCDAKSAVYLQGSSLDFTGNLIGGGFQFQNPNAARNCGCGTSFTPK